MHADEEGWLGRALAHGRVSRRDFLGYCGALAALWGLPHSAVAAIAKDLSKARKPTVVWLEYQDCAGNTESFLRASRPSVAQLILDTVSVDYHETIMAAAGHRAEAALADVVKKQPGGYIAIVEGSIPTGADGGYCMIGGRAALDIAREVCGNAAATIAIGVCAAYGGLPAAAPNPTGALSVADAVPHAKNIINIPACPANVENLTAVLAYYLTFQRWPSLDAYRRPLFAFGKTIHDACERRAHFDAGQYVEAWGDAGHRAGYCLYKMGCKGPVTYQNCPVMRWNEGTSWPVGSGHPCLGCSEPKFWDRMTPFYRHVPGVPGFNVASTVDRVGLGLVAAVAGAFAAHGVVHAVTRLKEGREEPPPSGGGEAGGVK